MAARLPRPTRVHAGCYTVTAVGQTFTLMQVTERYESVEPWHVTNEAERLVATGRTLAAAANALADHLGLSGPVDSAR